MARSLHHIAGSSEEQVKKQLTEMARDLTGGDETDELLDKPARKPRRDEESEEGAET